MIRSGGSRRSTRAPTKISAARGVAARARPEQATSRTSGSGSRSNGMIRSTTAGVPGRVSSNAARARVGARREPSAALRLASRPELSIERPIDSSRALEIVGSMASIETARSTWSATLWTSPQMAVSAAASPSRSAAS